MSTSAIYTFNTYLRRRFGKRVQRLSLDAGFGCPNLDGQLSDSGCVYCNNHAFARNADSACSLHEQIADGIREQTKRFATDAFIAYFQAYSSTYAPVQQLQKAYDTIRSFPQICGLFVSTRPDCVNEDTIRLLASYQKDYLVWVEYGLQTTHDRILKAVNRNHTYGDFLSALKLSRAFGLNVGVHVILGLPGATRDDMLSDADRLARLDIQGIKFHVLHVLRGTTLEPRYAKGEVALLEMPEYVHLVCDCLERLKPECVILRLVSTADPRYLIAPLWIQDRPAVIAAIERELARRNRRQGALFEEGPQ